METDKIGCNRRQRKVIMHWILIILLLLVGTNISAYAKEGPFTREERRKLIPINKLITNIETLRGEKEKQPEKVLNVLGINKGEIIADVGAGTGFYTFRIADRVGIEGKVYAVEIEDELLDYIRTKMDKNKITNIIPIKSSDSGPNLPHLANCDKIIISNSYYYFKDPVMFMKNTLKALKPGGVVAIIDLDEAKVYKGSNKQRKKISLPSEVIEDMKSAGLELFESHDFLASRFFLVFKTNK
jgi:ubiquinone/menaquinone biosynthesis C-methylase UbiE